MKQYYGGMSAKEEQYMEIVEHPCYQCSVLMKIALIELSGPETFDEKELEIARSNGVLIKEQLNKTNGESYLANTCPNCGAFIGRFFVHDYQGGGKLYPLPKRG
jgi:predicted RNA-binding Zn-ribbon protein involved in translation (DUF1610 family)